ncbi:MAG: hypothetical protein L0Z68_02385 [Gammaproteobacteria bacterium]|nr:hypothetical protein [Gammaproteobacteria bacterium]
MNDFEDYKLGDTDDTIQIVTSEENREAATTLVQQAQYTLEITSRFLDPAIYDNDEFTEAVQALALRSKRSRIRILVQEPETVVKQGHRLLELAMNLSSFIDIRKPNAQFAGYNEAILIADATGYIHRQLADRFEATLSYNNRPVANELLRQFDEMWETAILDPNLRRLYI